jgi:hypothetical protein
LRERLFEFVQAHIANKTLPTTSNSDRKETIIT